MYKNIIFISFYYLECTCGLSKKESAMAEMYTQRRDTDLQRTISSSTCFRKTGCGHLKTLNHLNFSSLIDFPETPVGLSQDVVASTHYLSFASLIQLRLFSTSQPCIVWHKANA